MAESMHCWSQQPSSLDLQMATLKMTRQKRGLFRVPLCEVSSWDPHQTSQVSGQIAIAATSSPTAANGQDLGKNPLRIRAVIFPDSKRPVLGLPFSLR